MVQAVNNNKSHLLTVSSKSIDIKFSYLEILNSTRNDFDTGNYQKRLEEKFGIKVMVENIGTDQESIDRIGVRTTGVDVIIAPNILQEMATDSSKAEYYEQKIQEFFDSTSQLEKYFASMGLNYEPGGVVIHEDETVTYIGGCEDTSESVAEVRELNLLKQKKKLEYIENLNELISKLNDMSAQSEPIVVTTRKFMPDGSVLITTREDGKVVEQHRKKPHMISVRDPLSGEIKSEPFVSLFDLDFM